jgi:hypothetical protein
MKLDCEKSTRALPRESSFREARLKDHRVGCAKVLNDMVRITDGKVPVLCCLERVRYGQWCPIARCQELKA